jgi:hypothetical protein
VEKIWGAGNAAVMNALMGGSLEITRSAGCEYDVVHLFLISFVIFLVR